MDIKNIIKTWEQFKKDKFWKSETVDVEYLLLEQFSNLFKIEFSRSHSKTINIENSFLKENRDLSIKKLKLILARLEDGYNPSTWEVEQIIDILKCKNKL